MIVTYRYEKYTAMLGVLIKKENYFKYERMT